jgi:hypothetical protein
VILLVCIPLKIYAEYPKNWSSNGSGTVVNEANAVDGNPRTYSTLTNGTGPANEVTSQNLNG